VLSAGLSVFSAQLSGTCLTQTTIFMVSLSTSLIARDADQAFAGGPVTCDLLGGFLARAPMLPVGNKGT
jgi:hypothetical protein